jgi:hypothetical protein
LKLSCARNRLGFEVGFFDHLAHNVAFAGDGSDHFGLSRGAALAFERALALVAIAL